MLIYGILEISKGISQQKLAKDANITQNIVSKIEDWSYNPWSDILVKLASALGVTESVLLMRNIECMQIKF